MINLSQGIVLLESLPAKAEAIRDDWALAHYLSSFAIRFAPGMEEYVVDESNQPDFWLFLPFATASDFHHAPSEQVRKLAVASTCMIIYNILFDSTVDDPKKPDIHIQVLAEYALACMHEHLYSLFPHGSPFWEYYMPMYKRFLSSMIDERYHKGMPQPYSYADYDRISRHKMSMVLMNPIGLAVLGNVPERITNLLSAWEELNMAVVILDDIKDWEQDYREGNFTYLLAEGLGLNLGETKLPESDDALLVKILFSGVMENLYEQGARHLDQSAVLAEELHLFCLKQLAEERAVMFRKLGRQLLLRKLDGLREHLAKVA